MAWMIANGCFFLKKDLYSAIIFWERARDKVFLGGGTSIRKNEVARCPIQFIIA